MLHCEVTRGQPFLKKGIAARVRGQRHHRPFRHRERDRRAQPLPGSLADGRRGHAGRTSRDHQRRRPRRRRRADQHDCRQRQGQARSPCPERRVFRASSPARGTTSISPSTSCRSAFPSTARGDPSPSRSAWSTNTARAFSAPVQRCPVQPGRLRPVSPVPKTKERRGSAPNNRHPSNRPSFVAVTTCPIGRYHSCGLLRQARARDGNSPTSVWISARIIPKRALAALSGTLLRQIP